jgi:hypothetical protein
MACDNFTNALNNIAKAGTGPRRVQTDAGMVEQQPIADLIAAANYLAGVCAANTRTLGVRYTRLRPGATVQGWRGGPRWRDGGLW